MNIRRIEIENGRTLAWTEESGLPMIEKDGLLFKDAERSGELLPYEDWRLGSEERAKDLAGRLSIEEMAGLMLFSKHQMVPSRKGMPFVSTYNGKSFEEAGVEPSSLSDEQSFIVSEQGIRHILLVMAQDTRTSAKWSNNLQQLAEAQKHSIPVNISSDPRNGARKSRAEFKSAGQDVSKWPEGLGFAATFDPKVVRQFAEDASKEYRALGISTALGPQIDLCTEPRWFRGVDTLGEEADHVVEMVKEYCDGMQTTEGTADGWGKDSVNTMVKHWPGGGTGEGGRDAHYPFGKFNVYPAMEQANHLRPFTEGAFQLNGPTGKAAAVMPYYSISVDYPGKDNNTEGNSYSHYIVHDLLREKYEFDGVVCTDWGITQDPMPIIDSFSSRCYGVEHLSQAERCLQAIMNGVNQFGGDNDPAPVLEAYRIGCERYGKNVMEEKFRDSAYKLLRNIFRCGLFDDPYLDPEESAATVGCEEFVNHGFEAQCRSVVLLKNKGNVLPLQKGLKIYVPTRHVGTTQAFFRGEVPPYDMDPVPTELLEQYGTRVQTPEEADVAIVFAESPITDPFDRKDLEKGGNGYFPISLQYRPYTAELAREVSMAGGDFREDFTNRSYKGKTTVAANEGDLDNILNTKKAMGDKPVIVCETLNTPMVMGEFEPQVDAIVAEFGVSLAAELKVLFGEHEAEGRLPVQMPRDMETVETHCEDKALDMIPYTDSEGNTYDFGFGLKYQK